MNRTYITKLPDSSGSFLQACKIINNAGGKIIRVSYNKAVDTHFAFIEVNGSLQQHFQIQEDLIDKGFLSDKIDDTRLVLLVLKLKDKPDGLVSVLEIISQHNINISYINSIQNEAEEQSFKLGILIQNQDELKKLIKEIEAFCSVEILNYEITTKPFDGSVFYFTFTNEIKEMFHLTPEQTASFVENSNRIMQMLEEKDEAPMKTFEFIYKSARFIVDHKGDKLNPNITKTQVSPETKLYLIDVACGSNTAIFENHGKLLFIDCGFGCYKTEMLKVFHDLFPDFDRQPKSILLTHGDIDHTGLIDIFDKAYMVKSVYDNFIMEKNDKPNYREQNKLHAPYCRISKLITGYQPPSLENAEILGEKKDDEILSKVGVFDFGDLHFDVFEGRGGHVQGETVFVCNEFKFVFTGDILVNIKGFSESQREFNILAPYLMTSVNVDSKKAKQGRELLLEKYKGYTFYTAHGSPIL